jgi:hypothetical protein
VSERLPNQFKEHNRERGAVPLCEVVEHSDSRCQALIKALEGVDESAETLEFVESRNPAYGPYPHCWREHVQPWGAIERPVAPARQIVPLDVQRADP